MSITLIEDLAYSLKKGRESGKRAIVFLGAGASKTGGIPLAGELMVEILKKYSDVPAVKRLSSDDQKSYTKVMAALGPVDRKELFKEYIDKASINASHIYLAHMMKEGFIDFVFTVNFDNLMQRALGLFNMYPAVYDMAMLKGMTTAPFESPGLVYLHGQYHGFNLLNTEDEFKSVSELLKRCFISVANRPWIVVGYSGEDPVLSYINELGRFEHGLYWVCYNDKDPSDRVCSCFFSNSEKNTFKLKGCDADSFFVKLHAELSLPQPPIIDTPFSYLKGLQESIVDIKGDDLKKANERLTITKNWISQAINTYEQLGTSTTPDKDKIEVEKILKSLIDIIITEKYELLPEFNKYDNDSSVREHLAIGHYDWGGSLYDLGSALTGTEAILYFKQSTEKYERAVTLKPDYVDAYINWGISLNNLGRLSVGIEALNYFKQAIEKYEHAANLKPHDPDIYNNWGISLDDVGRTSTGAEALTYFEQAIEKHEHAVNLNPNDALFYNNWGISIADLGRASTGEKAITYFKQAIEKYEQAISLKPDDALVYFNWGNILDDLGRASTGIEAINYYKQAIKKYERAISLKSDDADSYNNCGICFTKIGQASTGAVAISYFKQAIEKYEKAVSLKPDDAIFYSNWGDCLNALGQTLTGAEAITYLKQAIEKYEQAVTLKPDNGEIYDDYSATLLHFSYVCGEEEKNAVLTQAFSIAERGYVLAGKSYNLSCSYALLNDTTNAFKYLEETLQNGQITFTHVSKDKDWEHLRTHPEYLKLKEQYDKTS